MRTKLIIFLSIVLLLIPFSVFAQNLNIALVSDIGGFGDHSYNDQLRESLINLEKENIVVNFKESNQMTEYVDNINYYAENDFDLIFGVGFTMEQAIKENAQMYPDKNFIIFDGIVEEENVLSIVFKKEEVGFLAGVTAALATENERVAFIGGKNNSEIKKYQQGFNSAVKAVNSEVKIFNQYIGSFNDYSKAKEVTKQFAEEKIDIIFYVVGPGSKGIINSALENNIKLITLNHADLKLAPKQVITVIDKNTNIIADQIISNYLNNKYTNGIKSYGLESNAIILAKDQLKKILGEEILNKIENYKRQYLEDEIKI